MPANAQRRAHVRVGGALLLVAALSGALRASAQPAEDAPDQATAPDPIEAPAAAADVDEAAAPEGKEPPPVPMQPLSRAINLTAGDSCLEHERLVKRIARWLERDAVDARIRVQVIGEDDTDIRFLIDRSSGESSERRIEGAPEDCRQLHAAVALSIALAIDATRPDASAVELDLPDDDELLEGAGEPEYLRGAIAASIEAGSGLLTDVSSGGSFRFELGPEPWLDLRLGAFGTLVGDQGVGSTPGRFDVDLIAARVEACPVTTPSQKLRVTACFGAALGRFRTSGSGFATSFTESRAWSALTGAVEAQLAFSSVVAVAVHVGLALPLSNRSIQVLDADGEVADDREPPVAGMIVGVGPVFRLF